MPSARLWNLCLAATAFFTSAVLWSLYFSYDRDLYKLFALLGLTSGLVGLCLLGARFGAEQPWCRPAAFVFFVLGFFLHGFANFTPDLFGEPEQSYASPAQCEQGSQDDDDMDEGPLYPDV